MLLLVHADVIGTLGGVLTGALGSVGSVFTTISGAVLGAFTWTISLAANFILTTLAAFVRMLIPQSWANEGDQIMAWIVHVPNFAGQVSSPGGGTTYGFAGVNALRDLFTWLGVAVLPLTLTYGVSRSMVSEREPVAIPIARVVAVVAVLISYPFWFGAIGSLVNSITGMVLGLGAVSAGLHKLMAYAVEGVALGGWQLIDLALMGATAIMLLGLIFFKVVLIVLGALLYATGPLMIGLVATESGAAMARAWLSAVVLFLAVPVVWTALFAVGAVLINDSSTAGPLIAGSTSLGSVAGGLLLAVAGLVSLWLCLKAAREAGGLLRLQLGGLLSLRHGSGGGAGASVRTTASSASTIRQFGARVGKAAGAAGGELAASGPAGAAVVRGTTAARTFGRRGLAGTAAVGAGAVAAAGAPRAAAFVARSRAGAVAVNMARAGTASWRSSTNGNGHSNGNGNGHSAAGAAVAADAVQQATGKRPRVKSPSTRPSRAAGPTSGNPTIRPAAAPRARAKGYRRKQRKGGN